MTGYGGGGYGLGVYGGAMPGLPDATFELDDGTGTFPHDVTGYARLLDGFSFNRGREDEQAAVTSGSLNLAFNNADGRFTPGSTTIATPSPITVDQRIRLKETVNGTTFTRFTGYVKSWRVSWPAGVDTHSVVHATATDIQARAERRVLRSVIQEEILADGPAAYYTLGEPEGAQSAADSSGNQAPALTMAGAGTDVAFGNATGPGTDGLTAAEFAGGKYLVSDYSRPSAGGDLSIEAWFATTATNGGVATFGQSSGGTGLKVESGAIFPGIGGPTVNDGLHHHAVLTIDAAFNMVLYVDGVEEATSFATAPAGRLWVGVGDIGSTTYPLVGTAAHVAVWPTVLSAAEVSRHYEAGATGFAGESGTDRITRIAGYADIPLGTLDTSLTNVPHKDITGASAWSAIADVTAAEGGLTVVDGSGNAVFTNRNDAPEKTAPDLTVAASYVQFDASPTDDDAEILNYLETTAEGTQVTQVVVDATSEGTHGRYPESKSYLVQTDAEALDRANWIVANYAEPTTRYGTLTINLFGMTAAEQEAVIANAEPGAWLRVTDMPAQTTGGTTVDVMVQGFTEQQNASEWTLTCNIVARSLFQAAIYDDATYGVYGESKCYY
jgi:hypothetical protein